MSYIAYSLVTIVIIGLLLFLVQLNVQNNSISEKQDLETRVMDGTTRMVKQMESLKDNLIMAANNLSKSSLDHLRKHHDINIDGIDDTVTAVVECSTTKGTLMIDVRDAWAPLGSQQFLKLVDKKFFTNLPFFRVCPRYITQFGAKYGGSRMDGIKVIQDDKILWGKRDMDFGYVFFAGSGPNSRYNEMVIALCMMKGCKVSGLGNEPWEVPIGTIRKEGFSTLQAIAASGFPYPKLEMLGQHPEAKGPDRRKLETDKNYLKNNYPNMEYFQECKVISRNQHITRPLTIDHPDTDMTLNIINLSKENNEKKESMVEVHGLASSTDSFFVEFIIATTQGEGKVIFQIFPLWAPLGATRFKDLVENKFFDGCKFFRVIKNFMAQFGINGNPVAHNEQNKIHIQDDPFIQSNSRGTLSFATSGPNTRSTQLFINLVDNKYLDKDFEPIGKVVKGMQYVDLIYDGYGEGGNGLGNDGKGPSQGRINREGNAYLDKVFPKLKVYRQVYHHDYTTSATSDDDDGGGGK